MPSAAPKQPDKPPAMCIGHGIGDLTPAEQAAYANRPRVTFDVPKVQQQFVRVPMPDYDAEGYRQSIAAELKTNPHYAPLLERIRQGAALVADGLRTKARREGEPQADIIATGK